MNLRFAAALAAGALTLAAVAGCGSSAPAAITAHGTVTVFASVTGGQNVHDAYPDITSGSQVTVTNSSGKVIGTGTLAYSRRKTVAALQSATAGTGMTASELTSFAAIYEFTTTVPGGLPRYGIKVGNGRGTIFFTARQMKRGPSLSLGSLT